jgi:hypothetical protein
MNARHLLVSRDLARGQRLRAFTLTEMMAAGAVFGLVMAAVVFSNFHGMRMLEAAQPKLAAENTGRRLFNRLSDEITSAKLLRLGEGDAASFTPVAAGALLQGGALQLHSTADTNVFIRYFWNPGDQTLNRCTSDSFAVEAIAHGVTNSQVFAAVDYRGFPGGVLTNDQRSLAISVLLEFSEIEGTGTPVGPDRYFKSHQFQAAIARRAN